MFVKLIYNLGFVCLNIEMSCHLINVIYFVLLNYLLFIRIEFCESHLHYILIACICTCLRLRLNVKAISFEVRCWVHLKSHNGFSLCEMIVQNELLDLLSIRIHKLCFPSHMKWGTRIENLLPIGWTPIH